MDRCVLLTSTPECVVSPRRAITRACALVIARRGETTHSGVDVNNTHLSMINPLKGNDPSPKWWVSELVLIPQSPLVMGGKTN